ncbi:MAG TPA: response regulator, partial [Desulfuromonadales bacterium]|nr:response regulator [Desulfuromonadales bacterium]
MEEKPIDPEEILVVDDDEAFARRFVRETLKGTGCAVAEAKSGEQALEIFRARKPDAVLLDAALPGMGGFEVCRAIRRLPGGEHAPVLMITGGDEEEPIRRAFEAGATDVIGKPLNEAVLRHRLRQMLGAARTDARLRGLRKRLLLTQQIAGLGDYEWNVPRNVWKFSKESRRILGIEDGAAADEPPFFLTAHPEERAAVGKALAKAVERTAAFNVEYRVVWPDGR